jgi:hypothetical protein
VATDSSTLSPTASPVETQLGTYLSFPEWKEANSGPATSVEEDLPKYLDYYRVEALKRGELTQQKESEIQDYYVNWFTRGEPVSDEEYALIANQSTSYVPGSVQEASLVSSVFPNIDWAALEPDKQQDYLNRSKRALLQSGSLPYASILEGDTGVIHIGNYDSQGTSPDKRTLASNEALESFFAGAVDPRDLWQISEGLDASGIPNKTKFQADIDRRDLTTLQVMLMNPESEAAQKISEAIGKTIDLESYRKEGNWWNQLFADRPEEINQIISQDIPPELAEIQPLIMQEIAKQEGWGDAFISGIDANNTYRYSNERLFRLIKELAITHANNQGVFKYDADDNKNNIRISPMGLPIAHPELMKRGDFNEIITADDRLSSEQISALKATRTNFIANTQLPAMDKMWSDDHLDSVVGDKWTAYKTENPNGMKDDPEAFYDTFVKDKANYDQSKNWWGGVLSSVPNAVLGIGASLGALLGNDNAARYAANHQKKEGARKQTANIFGENLGFGYDLATTTSQVVADIGATYLLAGPLTKVGKLASLGSKEAKHIMAAKTSELMLSTSGSKARQAARKRLRNLVEESGVDSSKTKAALQAHNDLVAKEFGIKSSIFLTAANRSAGGMYATVYNSLPEEMSHEEKHDKALGPALVAGTLTGAITTGFSALGMGGAEDIVSRAITYRQLKSSLNRIGGAEWVNDSTTKALLKKPLRDSLVGLVARQGDGVLGRTVRGAVSEGVEEGLDEFVNSFVETSATNQFMPMKDRLNQSMYAMSLGGVLGGTITLAGNYTVGLDKLRALAKKKAFDPQQEAENIAIENAALALQESGLDMSAEQLQAILNAKVETENAEAVSAGAVAVAPETKAIEEIVPETDVQESQVQESEEPPINIISPDFNGNVTSSLVQQYIQGWRPSDAEQQDLYLDFRKIDGGRPMRVGVLRANDSDNPLAVWQIDSEALASELNSTAPEERQRTLDKYISHELIHVSETNHLKNLWRQSGQQVSFLDFSRNYLNDMYSSIIDSANGEQLIRESMANHLGISVAEVNLPGEQGAQMDADEVVSEFTRQFVEVSKGKGLSSETITRYKQLPSKFLAWVQGLVGHVRSFLGDTSSAIPKEPIGLYAPVNKELRNHLNGVENLYTDILRSSLLGKKFDFEASPVVQPEVEPEPQEPTAQEEVAQEQLTEYQKLWDENFKEHQKANQWTGNIPSDKTLAKREDALINLATAHILSNPEINITESQFRIIEGYFDSAIQQEGKVPAMPNELRLNRFSTKISKELQDNIKDVVREVNDAKLSSFLAALNDKYRPDVDIRELSPQSAYDVGSMPIDLTKLDSNPDTTIEPEDLAKKIRNVSIAVLGKDFSKVISQNEKSESFHDPVYVNNGTVIYNTYAMPKALENSEAESVLKAHVTLKTVEDEYLNSIPDGELEAVYSELSPEILSFLSKEADNTFATGIKTVDDIQNPETGDINKEVAKEIITNYIKKYSSEAISESSNFINTYSFINSFPGLKGLAINNISNIHKKKGRTKSAQVVLLNTKLGDAKLHLDEDTFIEDNSKHIPFDNYDLDNGLDLVRNIVFNSATKKGDEIVESISPLRTTLEVPIGEIGAYKAPGSTRKGWVKKLWGYLAGVLDPRWKREQEARISFMDAIKAEANMYVKAIDKEIKNAGGIQVVGELLEKASGSTSGNEISEEFLSKINSEFQAEKQQATADFAEDIQGMKQAFTQASKNKRQKIEEEKVRVSEQNKMIVKQALRSLSEISPELADLVKGARAKITEASKFISDKLTDIDPKAFEEVELRFNMQEGFYLTRSYRIFKDPEYRRIMQDPTENTYKGMDVRPLKVKAGREMLKQETERLINNKISELDKQAVQNNDLTWFSKSDPIKRIEVEEMLTNDPQTKVGLVANDEEALTYFTEHIAKYSQDETNILARKKEIPKVIRQAMGEVELPQYNLVQTLTNVKQFANKIAETENLFTLGTQGELKDRWILTNEEFEGIISDEGRQRDPELYNAVKDYVPVTNALPSRLRRKYNRLYKDFEAGGNYRIHPDIATYYKSSDYNQDQSTAAEASTLFNSIVRRGVAYALGAKTMGSTTYYSRNIAGNLTFFPLSQGMSPKGITFMVKELKRAFREDTVDESIIELRQVGMLEPDFTSSMLQDMIDGKYNETTIQQQTFAIFDEIQRANGLDPIADNDDKSLVDTLKKLKDKGLKVPDGALRKLQRLSLATDSWYKIGYYLHEKKNLETARQHDIDNNLDTGYQNLTNQQIKAKAIDKVKKTAQFYSQSSPAVEGWNRSSAGVLFAPYVRFRVETARIMVNTIILARQEIASDNPVIYRRGWKRLAGALSVGTVSATGSILMEPIFLTIAALAGYKSADDLDDEMREALQLSVPPYLRDHTFLYTKKNGKYQSWDLTYLNPYAMWLDMFPVAGRMMKQGHAPHEAMLYAGTTFLALPFVEGQIATKSFFNTMQNKNSKGEPIWFENDSPVNKAVKGISSYFYEAYDPPVRRVATDLYARFQTGDTDNLLEEGFRSLVAPLKPYEVDPTISHSNYMRALQRDRLQLRKKINRLVSDRPMSDSDLEDLARENIEMSRKIAKASARHAAAWQRLGVTPEVIIEKGKQLLPRDRWNAALSGDMYIPEVLQPGIKKIISQDSAKVERYSKYLDKLSEMYDQRGVGLD